MNITLQQVEEAISSLHVMTAFLDCDFNFIRVNHAYAAATGKTPAEFVGKNHFALYPNAENEAIFRRVRDSREPYTVRAKPFDHPDQPDRGTTYWDWHLQPMLDKDNLVGLSLILIDVTEHEWKRLELKDAYELIAAKEARYHSLFDSVSDALFVLESRDMGKSNYVIDINDAACQRLGYTKKELLGKSPADFNAPNHPKNIAQIEQSMRETGRALFETIHIARDGRQIPTEVSIRVVRLGEQTIIYAVARDITDRKKLEAAILLDESYRVLAANDIVAKRFNLSVAELVGKQDTDLMPVELAFSRRKRLEEARQKRIPVNFEDERNGLRSLITINPVIDENNEIHRFAIYARDVTEQRQIEAVEHILSLIHRKILESTPIQELLELVCHETVEAFSLSTAWIGKKLEDGSIRIEASGGKAQEYIGSLKQIGVRWDDTPLGRGPTGTSLRTGTLQVRHLDDVRFSPWKQAAASQGLKSVLAVPLILRGNIYGAFTLYSALETRFDASPIQNRMNLLAGKICLALEIAMEQEQIKLLSTALTSAHNAVMITDATGLIQWVNTAFTELCGYGAHELIGRRPSILKSGRHDTEYYKLLWNTLLAGNVWSADAHERRKDGKIYTVQQTITPITNDSGEVTHFVAVHEDVTAKLETQERIQHLASHDTLTGLPNRSLFYDRLANLLNISRRNKTELGLLFIDLDGFKQVNDSQGHHIGDLLLQAVAQRLLVCTRESDTVARFGGDEFVVILYDVNGQEDAAHVAGKIIAELSTPFQLEKLEVKIGASVGVAISQPDELEDQLTQRADAAMYEAKREGKNTFRFAQTKSA